MQFSVIRDRVKGFLGNRSDATDTLVNEAINRVYRELAVPFFFDELETTDTTVSTVASTASYDVPSALYSIDSIRDTTNYRDLIPKEMDWYEERPNTSDAQPEYYVVYGNKIYLHPAPDDVYSLRMRGISLPTALSTDTDEPVYPEDWHYIIVLSAAADLLFYFAMDERAMLIKNEALSRISTRTEKRTLRRATHRGQMNVIRKGV